MSWNCQLGWGIHRHNRCHQLCHHQWTITGQARLITCMYIYNIGYNMHCTVQLQLYKPLVSELRRQAKVWIEVLILGTMLMWACAVEYSASIVFYVHVGRAFKKSIIELFSILSQKWDKTIIKYTCKSVTYTVTYGSGCS